MASILLALLTQNLPAGAGEDFGSDMPVSSGLSVQFTDNFLHGDDWRNRLDLVTSLGATIIRIDLNWPWIERESGHYNWTLYDDFAAELAKRHLRPIFILNRPNPIHGKPFGLSSGRQTEELTSPPVAETDVAAYAQWAAAAADRYQFLDPIWELWNEPDEDGFWPPKPDPQSYVVLARKACVSIKQRVPKAFVTGPAAAQMPTVWRPAKPLITAVLGDDALLTCLDAISLHTHRFKQTPETVSRDYGVLRAKYLADWPGTIPRKPIIDTEWGDSVYSAGINEDTQARWLPRMFLINLMEQVRLTNWYCLEDVGSDPSEMENRFGLIRYDGSQRPAYSAYTTLAHQLGGLSLRETIARFDPLTAKGITILRFCDITAQQCKLAFWSTESDSNFNKIAVPGWHSIGPVINHLGETVSQADNERTTMIQPQPFVQYVSVARSH